MYQPDNATIGHGLVEKQGCSGCQKVIIGCGIVLLILLIAGGLFIWWLTANFRRIGADYTTKMLKQGMRELKLPADQQTRIFQRIDQISQQFKDQETTLEQVGHILEVIGESPLMPAGTALLVQRAYLDKSGLAEAEKEAARLSIRRFARGAIAKSISEEHTNEVLDLISTKDSQDNQRQFEETLTDAQLRLFIAEAKKAADEAGVAAEIPEINFADEFDKAVDQALADLPDESEEKP